MGETTWLPTARKIVEERQYQYVHPVTGAIMEEEEEGSVLLDGFTASMLVQVYDALQKPSNREKFASLPLLKAADVGWRLVS